MNFTEEDLTRRDLLGKLGIGLGVAGTVAVVSLESSCSTSTVLADLDTIVGDAIIVANTLTTSPVTGPVASLLVSYLNSVKSGVDAAITINNDTSLSAAVKAAQIAEIFVNLAIANIPGLPSLFAPLIGTLEIAINTLLGLLHSTATTSFVKTHPHFTLSLTATGHLSSHNKQLGSAIAAAVVAVTKAKVAAGVR